MPWKAKYSAGDYIESQGFGTDHHNEFNDSPSGEINEEVTIFDKEMMTVNVHWLKLLI
jgi:hypothetical protein